MGLRTFSLQDMVERNARLHGSRTAFVFGEQRITHAEYAARCARLAAGLASAGVKAGDRVAVLAPNCLKYVDLFGAAARLAAIAVPINWRLSAEEVAHVIADVSPTLLIVAAEFQALVPAAAPGGIERIALSDMQRLYVDGEAPPAATDDDTGFVIIHTAAVGGRARGALLSHGNLVAAALQSQATWRLTPDDVFLGALPLFHIAGLGMLLAVQMAGGATRVLPKFEPQALVKHIDSSDGGSLIGTFPPMLGALLDAAASQGSALANLRTISGIDAPETIARFQAGYPHATFWSAYGQTEVSGSISLAPFAERPGSAGRPTMLNTVAIVDDLDQPAPIGASGEIVVRGPMVFQGYWQRDEDNAFTLRNGWHHTGDMGRLDADGYLWYGGRSPAKELIKPGGENVYPAEVERAILEHPAIAEVVVIGVPDVQWGEAVKAVCVLKDGQTADAAGLIEFVGARIARYKKPKHVVFVDALPRTAAGVIDRAAVKGAHGGG